MSHVLNISLEHLAKLVGFDTQNPPRAISQESDIFKYLQSNLPEFSFEFFDAGEGCIALLAVRGSPQVLFNFHIDTVPVAPGWNTQPHNLHIVEDKAFGLGACDIKGAAACMLTAANQTDAPLALLFSSDEEHGNSAAIRYFLAQENFRNHNFKQVIVAEPTQCQAVIAHRGIQTAKVSFAGISGHASEARAISDNAIHKASLWTHNTINWITSQNFKFENLSGLPFNIGKVEGGIKANMIAADCEMAFGFRPLPGQSPEKILESLLELSPSIETTKISAGFSGPSLPASNQDFDCALEGAKKFAKELQLPLGKAVNFWTEASLFSQSGLTAIVYGPGDIAQAHTPNEWVLLSELETASQKYISIIEQNQTSPTLHQQEMEITS